MSHLRILMLTYAATLATVAGVQAADLPVAKATPVEYVQVCTTYGKGFFYVPGTDGCLRISGRVRADYLYLEPFNRVEDAIGFRARGRLNVDHRTMTAYGTLRAYIRYEFDRNTGVFTSPGGLRPIQRSTRPMFNSVGSQPDASRRSSQTRSCRRRISGICASTTRRTQT